MCHARRLGCPLLGIPETDPAHGSGSKLRPADAARAPAPPGLVEIEVRPFVQGEACIALLSVASRHEAFNELDNKFIHLFGNQLAGRLHDMLMRQRSTRLLEASETRYRSLAENSADWIWVMNLDGQLIYSNERCRNVTGLSPAKSADPLDALYHPDDRNMVRDIIRQAQNSRQGWNNLLHRFPAHGRHVPPPGIECLRAL